MKYIIFIFIVLQVWSFNSNAQTTNKTVKINAFSLELGVLLADSDRFGYALGLACRADRHLFQLQASMDRELFAEFDWLPNRTPLPAKIIGTNNFSLMYGYSLMKVPNFQITPLIGLIGGRELYRTGEYVEVEGFLWNTYAYYHQLNDYLGVSGAVKVEGYYRFLGAFSQFQVNHYGRTTLTVTYGIAIYLYNRKPRD